MTVTFLFSDLGYFFQEHHRFNKRPVQAWLDLRSKAPSPLVCNASGVFKFLKVCLLLTSCLQLCGNSAELLQSLEKISAGFDNRLSCLFAFASRHAAESGLVEFLEQYLNASAEQVLLLHIFPFEIYIFDSDSDCIRCCFQTPKNTVSPVFMVCHPRETLCERLIASRNLS